MAAITEHGFTLDLPGAWEQTPTEDPGSFAYREVDGSGTVTVMLLAVRPVYAIADRTRLLGDYADHRSKYEAGQTPSLEQSEPVVENTGDSVEATWSGTDVEAGRLRQHRAVMAGDILADFCYEAAGEDEEAFAERAAVLLGSAAISFDEQDEEAQP